MRYTRFGNTGLIVSRLSFGAMTFGSYHSIPSIFKVDQENARSMVESALGAGINFFDTADTYSGGQSEAILGEALAPRRNSKFRATTNFALLIPAGYNCDLKSTGIAPTEEIPGDLVIIIERSICFGTCPAYKLTISANDSVEF
jgi:predicted aldo/keto reductase-like oxidoreductase